MKPRSEASKNLYQMMLDRGYPVEFCEVITQNLNTDFTAGRMIGYLSHYQTLPMEEIVDEMLAILTDRNRIMQKKNWSVTTPSGMNTWQMAFLMTRSNAEIQIFYIYNNTPIDIT